MDTFKLLARSTNLQKSKPSADKASKQQTPSSGFESQGTQRRVGHGDLEESRSQLKLRGTKRRKKSPAAGPNSKSTGKQEYIETKLPLDNTSNDDLTINSNSGKTEQHGIESQPKRKGIAERRKILKQNKLKIALLADGQKAKGANATPTKEIQNPNTKKHDRSLLISEPLTSFEELRTRYRISRRLAENLDAQGYRYPTEVQVGSLPLLLGSDEDRGLATDQAREPHSSKVPRSDLDLLTVAPTGSGKTLAFIVNVIHHLLEDRQRDRKTTSKNAIEHEVQALIVAPTHELADQIVNEGRKLAIGTGLRVSAMKKDMMLQTDSLATFEQISNPSDSEGQEVSGAPNSHPIVKADILVSTPMLLVNAISENQARPSKSLPSVRYLVLDEADILLDPLFRSQTLSIWDACTNPSLQTTLWSATIGSSIESLAQSTILSRRKTLGITSEHHIIRVVVGLKDSAIPNVTHRLTYAATEQGKLLALRQLLHPSAPSEDDRPSLRPPFLVFTQTIQRAIALHSELLYDIPPEAGGSARIAVLHSELSDSARATIMAGFRNGQIWILITTDLLSRGVDFRGMNGVVNYDIPTTGAAYVHRAGRTGRQGREGGVAVTLYTKEDIPYVKNIANVIAAGERARGEEKSGGESKGEGERVQNWLLDALPKVSKKSKRELKQRGVESRRNVVGVAKAKEQRRARISTKSGYDRRIENRRKGAAKGARLRGVEVPAPAVSEDEWGGFED
ncbi:MAG: RNA-dependent ATPase rok1 [Heterodermia speciosa]|uniref:ATP-dependent RNA helicase n=1 Tax=Heterodermia speciosa TaxID=116794 RepID=A0A8H3EXF8_9LECA|nr:MAG: RNA-dependent ATPase rok1 [Heterodermia speciosa]